MEDIMPAPLPIALLVIRAGMVVVAGALSIVLAVLRNTDTEKKKDEEKEKK